MNKTETNLENLLSAQSKEDHELLNLIQLFDINKYKEQLSTLNSNTAVKLVKRLHKINSNDEKLKTLMKYIIHCHLLPMFARLNYKELKCRENILSDHPEGIDGLFSYAVECRAIISAMDEKTVNKMHFFALNTLITLSIYLGKLIDERSDVNSLPKLWNTWHECLDIERREKNILLSEFKFCKEGKHNILWHFQDQIRHKSIAHNAGNLLVLENLGLIDKVIRIICRVFYHFDMFLKSPILYYFFTPFDSINTGLHELTNATQYKEHNNRYSNYIKAAENWMLIPLYEERYNDLEEAIKFKDKVL